MTSLNPQGWSPDALTQRLVEMMEKQTELIERFTTQKEVKVEGISLPHFHGKMGDSVELYFDQVEHYFEAKNIDWLNVGQSKRVIAMMTSNFKGNAAAWYMLNKSSITTVAELKTKLTDEFVPPDLQERLRDRLYSLSQKNCSSLEDYISKFRVAIMQVKDMGELDKITYFNRGLITPLREEVQYRRCQTISAAMTVALEYDRSHGHYSRGQRSFHHQRHHEPPRQHAVPTRAHEQQAHQPASDEPEPMEIDSGRHRERRAPRKKCTYCKKQGHSYEQCYMRMNKERNRSRNQQHHRSSINALSTNKIKPSPSDELEEGEVVELHEINSVESSSPKKEEEIAHTQQETSSADVMQPSRPASELIRLPGRCDGKSVVIMLDSGSTMNVVRPGLTSKVRNAGTLSVTRFDGTSTASRPVKKGIVDIDLHGFRFKDIQVTEWPMGPSHDVILGKPWFSKFQPSINWRTHEISFPFRGKPEPKQEIAVIEFATKMQQDEYEEVYRVKVAAVDTTPKEATPEPIKKLIKQFEDVFPDALPDGLPPSRRVEFELNMKRDAQPSNRPPFRLSKTEQDALDLFVEEKMKKGWIEVSDSPWVSNIFGIPKKDPQSGKQLSRAEWIRSGNATLPIRWVIDYRYVNSQTNIPKIPLPRIDELFDRMAGCCVYSVLDLAQGYHQMRIAKGSRKYTAFRTHAETYQWCVAPMGLAGMPGVWSRLMRVLFAKYPFIAVYLDDICVFSKSLGEHLEHLRILFEELRKAKLFCHQAKCHFGQSKVHFLGHTISVKGLEVDEKKTEAIAKWSPPSNQKELQSFLGLAGYYRRFIQDYAKLALPLSPLVKKEHIWRWGRDQQQSFDAIKAALQTTPVLKLPDYDKVFIVTTDASKHCVGGVLSQVQDGHDHPLAFFSKKLGEHELNWPTHEKELFAIKLAMEKWRHYLYGRPFEVYTDNSACQWLLHHPKVSPKLARFLTFFAQFTFRLHHVKGKLNVVADALSRQREEVSTFTFHECNADCRIRDARKRSSLKFSGEYLRPGESVSASEEDKIHYVSTHGLSNDLKSDFITAYRHDPMYRSLYQTPSKPYFKVSDMLYMSKGEESLLRLVVPSSKHNRLRTKVIQQFHDADIAAHPGTRRTTLRIAQWYYWPTLENDVKEYVQSCETCTRWKHSNARKNGKMIPIPIPKECWEVVSMDFITGLPKSEGHDAIMVVVDKLSKRARYRPVNTKDDAVKVAHHFFDSVIRHHGVPSVIISDRDPKFISAFWKSLAKLMGTQLNMTTAHRAQADGQTERQNLVLEDALRCMVSYQGKDWARHLGTIEYAHSNLVSASTGHSPFELDTGRKERHPFGSLLPESTTDKDRSLAEYAKEFMRQKTQLIESARETLQKAQEDQKRYYDRKRSSVTFKQGDLVMLDTRNLPLHHSAKEMEGKKRAKFAARKIGPFEIKRMINDNAARLNLPENMRFLAQTFNVDLLSHYVPNPDKFATRPIPKASRLIEDKSTGEDLHIVEKLLKKRQFNRKKEWLVKWHGLPEHEATWELEKNIRHVSHWKVLVDSFKHRQEVNSGRMSGWRAPRHPSRLNSVEVRGARHLDNLNVL